MDYRIQRAVDTRKPESMVTGSGFRSLLLLFGFISAPPVFLRLDEGGIEYNLVFQFSNFLMLSQVSDMVFVSAPSSLCAQPIEYLDG
jgi:hypothetical protein